MASVCALPKRCNDELRHTSLDIRLDMRGTPARQKAFPRGCRFLTCVCLTHSPQVHSRTRVEATNLRNRVVIPWPIAQDHRRLGAASATREHMFSRSGLTCLPSVSSPCYDLGTNSLQRSRDVNHQPWTPLPSSSKHLAWARS